MEQRVGLAFRAWTACPARPAVAPTAPGSEVMLTPGMTVDEAEQKLILATLDAASGNKTRAAEMLGISLKTLYNRLKDYSAGDA